MQEQINNYYNHIQMSEESSDKIEQILLESTSKARSKKRLLHSVPKMAVACAAILCVLIVGEVTSYAFTGESIIRNITSFANNASFATIKEDDGEKAVGSFDTSNVTYPAEWIDDRLIITANGEHIDITDAISDTEAYVYTYEDSEEVTHIFIIGGEPETFGFAEFMKDKDGQWLGGYYQGGKVGEGINPDWLEKAKDENNIPW